MAMQGLRMPRTVVSVKQKIVSFMVRRVPVMLLFILFLLCRELEDSKPFKDNHLLLGHFSPRT